MLNFETIQTAFFGILSGILSESYPDLEIVRKYQNYPKPANPRKGENLLAYWVTLNGGTGHDDVWYTEEGLSSEDPFTFNYSGIRELTLELDAEGPSSSDVMIFMERTMRTQAGRDLCSSFGVDYITPNIEVNTYSILLGGSYIQKAVCSLRFRFADTYSEELYVIETCEISPQLEG